MKKSLLILIIVMIALAAPVAFAEDEGVISTYCKDAEAFDFEAQTKCNVHSYVLSANKVMSDSSQTLVENIKDPSAFVVDLTESRKAFNVAWILASSLLVLMATYAGYMYISSAGFPEKREQAQNQLKSIIFAAIFIVALMPFIILTNEIGNATTNMFYSNYLTGNEFQDLTTLDTFTNIGGDTTNEYSKSLERLGHLTTTNSLFIDAANTHLISLHGRKVVLMFLVAIAPLALLLYYFEPTKEFGKLFGYLYFIELFIPVVFILVLWFASVLAPTGLDPTDQVSKMTILTASLFFGVFLHVVIVLAGVGKAVFNVMMERRILSRRV